MGDGKDNLVGKHIWFFDGECALCDRWVRFLLRHDRAGRFRIAELQSGFARTELPRRGIDVTELTAGAADPKVFKTFYLIANYDTGQERLYNRSRGTAFLLSQLDGGWGLYGRFLMLWPSWLLDPVYRFVNRVRYRWFGHKDKCKLPTAEQQARLVS